MYCYFQVSKSLFSGGLKVLVVVPAVSLGQPGLELCQVVRQEVAGVGDQAGEAGGHRQPVLDDGQPPVVGGQPGLDVPQTEHSEGSHVVRVEAPALSLGGGQAVVRELTVHHHNLRVGVLQLLRDPALRTGDEFLLNDFISEIYNSVTEVVEPANDQPVDCEELL